MQVNLGGEAGLFVINVADQEGLGALRARYPEGEARTVLGLQCPQKQFVAFTVPASGLTDAEKARAARFRGPCPGRQVAK